MPLPLSIESVSFSCIDPLELLLQVGSQVDAGVEVLPDEGVVLHILDVVLLGHVTCCQVSDSVH